MPNTPTLLSVVDTSGSLGNGAAYNGPARDMHVGFSSAPGVAPGRRASSIVVSANPANPATIKVQVSADWGNPSGPTWITVDQLAAPGGSQVSKEIPIAYRWLRIQVVNGATTQTVSVTTAFQE
jgi:hypothetical protein